MLNQAPLYNPKIHLDRQSLLAQLNLQNPDHKRHILVEAPAGYGKSVFISQYMGNLGFDYIWYDMDERDRDPVFFTGRLNSLLAKRFPAYDPSIVNKGIRQGEIGSETLPKAAKSMADHISFLYDRRFFMVFDDLHIVSENNAVTGYLRQLVLHLPGTVNLICLSRPVTGTGQLKRTLNPICITKDHLMMQASEIRLFLHRFPGIQADIKTSEAVFSRTEGWTMGIVAEAFSLNRRNKSSQSAAREYGAIEKKEFLKFYFGSQIFEQFPDRFQAALCRLSIVDWITPKNALLLTGDKAVFVRIEQMARENMFTHTAVKEKGFVFHNLFRDFLRDKAVRLLGETEVRKLKILAAGYYTDQKEYELALRLLSQAQDHEALQRVLKDIGMQMLAQNRLTTIQSALAAIPGPKAKTLSWVSFFLGVLCFDSRPDKALPKLFNALDRFEMEKDRTGQTLALSFLMNYYVTIDVQYNRGNPYLERLERLYLDNEKRLLPFYRIQTLIALSHGVALMQDDIKKAALYADQAIILATRAGQTNFKAMALINKGFICLFRCDYKGVHTIVETLFPFLADSNVTAYTKMMILLAVVNLIEEDGDFFTFRFYKRQVLHQLEGDLVHGSIMEPLLLLLDLDAAVAEGNFKQARTRIRAYYDCQIQTRSDHLASQVEHFTAFLAGLQGDAEEARNRSQQALSLRRNIGGRPYLALGLTITGAGLAFSGELCTGERHLNQAIALSREYQETYIQSSAWLHLAFLKLQQQKDCTAELEQGLGLMNDNGYTHVTALSPKVLLPLLQYALDKGLESDFCLKLARERLGLSLTPSERPFPLLYIKTLGNFSVTLGGKELFQASDLTLKQQQLWAMMVTAPGKRLGVEQIQTALWPESPPKKGRSSFDSMMGRLRKQIQAEFAPFQLRDYIRVKNGILELIRCRIDLDDFFQLARTGNRLFYQSCFWQAANAYRKALHFYQGGLLPGMSLTDAAAALKEYSLAPLLDDIVNNWCHMMLKSGVLFKEDLVLIERCSNAPDSNLRFNTVLERLHGLCPEYKTGKGNASRRRSG